MSKLSESQAAQILKSKEKTSALARMYGVSEGAVRDIRAGRRWKHLQEAAA
jgi:hypothetical protein